jgi:hypothetical protein
VGGAQLMAAPRGYDEYNQGVTRSWDSQQWTPQVQQSQPPDDERNRANVDFPRESAAFSKLFFGGFPRFSILETNCTRRSRLQPRP